MQTLTSISALRKRLSTVPRIAVVPTMGNLHEGHLALVDLAKRHSDFVVATIFVNRLQFGENEDFAQYPRTLARDSELLEARGVQILFAPEESDLYPEPQTLFVEPPPIANELCGAFRSGHFRGVATVVAKLFNIVRPQVAVFGKKDYQQLHIIRALVRQLDFPIEIIAGETVRAEDGLALSSRNRYLTSKERKEAPRLYQSLVRIKEAIHSGRRDFPALEKQAGSALAEHGWRIDYVSVRERDQLRPSREGDENLVVLAAAWLGTTRLIDNLEIAAT
jgi:pantoate--beta-alanine ligase